MQVTRATFIPLLAPGTSDRIDPGAVRDEYCGDLTVVYTFGPQFGRRVVTHADLDQLQLPAPVMRRSALEHLEVLASRAEFHGQPPALMLSFEGLESSLLLATDFWTRLEGAVPGELVVGVPARDVVVVTGSQSTAGLEKARRCIERVFFAGGEHLLTRSLLVRRSGAWEPFNRTARPAARPAGPAHQHGVGQPPRQFQEHHSWPGERVRPVSGGQRPAARPAVQPVAPAAHATRPGMPGPAPSTVPGPALPGPALPGPSLPSPSVSGPSLPGPALPPIAAPMGPVPGGPMPGAGGPPRPRGGRPAPVPQQRSAPSRRAVDYQTYAGDVAPYSAVPYSAMPYSAVPQSAVPYSAVPQPRSAMPYSAAPYSAVPYSAAPYSAAPYSGAPYSAAPYSATPYSGAPTSAPPRSGHAAAQEPYGRAESRPSTREYDEKPAYRDEPQTSDVRDRYAGYDAPQQQPSMPEYPASWGWAPERSASRPEWRSSPRARFTSR